MIRRTQTQLEGFDCFRLENEALTLWVTQSIGPRVLGLALRGGENLFAVLPQETLEYPGIGTFYSHGGHRLWSAPVNPARTYLHDNDPIQVSDVGNGVEVTQPVETSTGIQKSLCFTMPNEGTQVIIDHFLKNLGLEPLELAPWAITQVKTGGVAILPQATEPDDEFDLLPNRIIALWPYTEVSSAHITWGDRVIQVEAKMQSGELRLGFQTRLDGWRISGRTRCS